MANYANLKAAISQAIKTNGNQEITGQVLQDVLNSIVSVIGANYTFAGVATPATNPGTPDQNVVYLAMEGGTYTNFNAMVLSAGISLLMWNGTWTSETVMYGDGGVFDISVYKSSGGTLATYADLAAALDGGNNIPASARKGGMSVKFVQSSDNKYVQYRLMSDEWSTNTEDWAISDDGVYVENSEFVEVHTDAEDKILWAIQKDGNIYFGGSAKINGDIKVLGNMELSGVSYKVIESPEYLAAWVDAEDKVIFGLKADGKTYVGDADFLNDIKNNQEAIDEIKSYLANFDSLDIDALSSITAVDNPEFIEAETDSEGKILAGRTPDGAAFENVGFSTPKVSIDGHTIENVEDPEGRSEITTDSEGKIISYRDSDGVKHEEVGLVLSKDGLSNFEKALIDSGFQDGGKNFSSIIAVELPEPKSYGLVNLLIDKLPIEDSDLSSGYIEYYDFAGNYFRKSCEITSQGQSSKWFARTGGKGNYTLDITDGSEIKFGSWVPQDSFHLKGCAKDVTRGYLSTSYKFAWEIMNHLSAKPNRVLNKDSKITETSASGDRFTDWPSDARCLPDGFPVEIYINGEYWGLYALQLKKHRKNYSMKKSDYTSFFIDGDNLTGFWAGNIPWTQFEIKNPKDLICMDGSKYDGDNPKELIDSTSEYYNPSNKKHVGSAQTKAIIQSWPVKYQEIKDLINVGTQESIAEAKDLFAEYFDVNACIFVYIFNCTMRNFDSITKNTLWGTWKNGKVAPMLWDLDAMYGESWIGNYAGEPSVVVWNDYANAVWPLALLWSLYEEEIKDAYANLRRSGILSIDTWKTIIYSKWIERIGTEAYERDIEKWPETPSYRKNYTDTDNWKEIMTLESQGSYNLWDPSVSYNQGDNVVLNMGGPGYCVLYTAKQANINKCPVTKYYTEFPYVSGYFDSPKRMEKWMISQISICDTFMEYSND